MAGSKDNEPAAAALVRRWTRAEEERDALVRLARRVGLSEADAEDCVQESILVVVPRADLDESRMGGLLATVVKRRAIDIHRRAQAAARASRRLESIASCETEAPDELLCDRAEAEWSATVVDRLPSFQRQVLLARADGRSWNEIARDLSTSVKAVESAVSRARAAVRLAIASTLGIGLALARRWRQPASVVAGGTTAFVLIAAVTVPFLHAPHAPPAPHATDDGTRDLQVIAPAASDGASTETLHARTVAHVAAAPEADERRHHPERPAEPHTETIAKVETPVYEGRFVDKDFNEGEDEDRLTHARKCIESGYTLTITPPDEIGEKPYFQGHCNNDL